MIILSGMMPRIDFFAPEINLTFVGSCVILYGYFAYEMLSIECEIFLPETNDKGRKVRKMRKSFLLTIIALACLSFSSCFRLASQRGGSETTQERSESLPTIKP